MQTALSPPSSLLVATDVPSLISLEVRRDICFHKLKGFINRFYCRCDKGLKTWTLAIILTSSVAATSTLACKLNPAQYVTINNDLRHNFCQVCNVFDVQVQLLIAIPVPNNEASSSSIIPRLGRSLTEQCDFHVSPSTAFSAIHL